MSIDAAHKNRWQISEVVFGIPFLAAILLDLVVPLSFPLGQLTPVVSLVGAALIFLGVALIAQARRELAREGQPTDPGHPTGKIVTTGVFSVSRNPIYLGAAVFLIGVSLTLNILWVLILLLPALIACQTVLISPEERYLAAKFGDEYRSYTAAVYRWIGRSRSQGDR
jgi:protein-S-isoprenylcysteine O-methyltransferase Ste14